MAVGPILGHRRALIAANLSLAVITTLFFIARIGAKRMRRLPWTLDDSFLAISLFFLHVCVAGSVAVTTAGAVGQHQAGVSPSKLQKTVMTLWALQFPHVLAMTAARCSITLLFLRIFFTKIFRKLRYCAYSCIYFASAWLVISILIQFLHCRPLQYNWIFPLENKNHCFPFMSFNVFLAAWGLIVDAAIWSLPHFVVWKLQLRLSHKLAITAMFGLGILNIIMGVFRIFSLAKLNIHGDLTYDLVSAIIWVIAQISTAIILTCCPLLRPLFEYIVPKNLTRMGTSRTLQSNTKQPAIQVTTKIAVLPETSVPRPTGRFHDGMYQDPEAPTFQVERRTSRASSLKRLAGVVSS